jgi:hypothetical protein
MAILLIIGAVTAVICPIGYGQRGLKYHEIIAWERDCPNTDYCFEMQTQDREMMDRLIPFPWNDYYYEYYVRSCGGDYGMPLDYHPWRELGTGCRDRPGCIFENLTFPVDINGKGGTGEFTLAYTCRHDYCDSGSAATISLLPTTVITVIATVLMINFGYW